MKKEILLGDEAVALAAVHAGLTAAYSYPGTPASEVMEYLIRLSEEKDGIKAAWCVNEKVAYEEALGVSFGGKRCLVSMKHVGLNVAADPFMNSALTAINGGLVVVVADDPGMHSSQNEQDSRYFADFARIFCFEPSSHQEAYDMTRQAFDLSEKYNIPVMIRIVTRLSHSRSSVMTQEARKSNQLSFGKSRDWTLLPANARRRFKSLLEKQPELIRESETSAFNSFRLSQGGGKAGIIASGIAYRYVLENLADDDERFSLLKVSTYPIPISRVRELFDIADNVLVIEEGYPFIEKQVLGLFGISGKTVKGKLSGYLPLTGELSPDSVRKALGLEMLPGQKLGKIDLAGRPPQLCVGCPHIDTFLALNKVLEDYPQPVVFSDIGCYTLGALPPYNAMDTCVCMGASIGMAKGGAEAGIFPSVAVIGDSTFGHSGITPLLGASEDGADITVFILDNSTVAMTGGQPSYATGGSLQSLVRGVGVPEDHIRTITPLAKNLDENMRIIKEEIEYRGLSVIIPTRACIHEARRLAKKRSQQ